MRGMEEEDECEPLAAVVHDESESEWYVDFTNMGLANMRTMAGDYMRGRATESIKANCQKRSWTLGHVEKE